MATTDINTHYGKNIKWTVYRNGYNAFVGTLTLSGAAYDISSLVFTAYIRTPSGTQNKVTLTEASGITNGGAAGTLTIALTEAQLATLPSDRYFIVVEYPIAGKGDFPLCQGFIEISDETNPGTTTTTATIPVSIDGTAVSMAVTLSGVNSAAIISALGYTPANAAVPLDAFATELTFDNDRDLATVTGGTRTFTLAASGHINGVGIVARINTPVAVNFPAGFEAVNGSDSIVTTDMNIIIFRFFEDYDGVGTDKVLYMIKNQTAI